MAYSRKAAIIASVVLAVAVLSVGTYYITRTEDIAETNAKDTMIVEKPVDGPGGATSSATEIEAVKIEKQLNETNSVQQTAGNNSISITENNTVEQLNANVTSNLLQTGTGDQDPVQNNTTASSQNSQSNQSANNNQDNKQTISTEGTNISNKATTDNTNNDTATNEAKNQSANEIENANVVNEESINSGTNHQLENNNESINATGNIQSNGIEESDDENSQFDDANNRPVNGNGFGDETPSTTQNTNIISGNDNQNSINKVNDDGLDSRAGEKDGQIIKRTVIEMVKANPVPLFGAVIAVTGFVLTYLRVIKLKSN